MRVINLLRRLFGANTPPAPPAPPPPAPEPDPGEEALLASAAARDRFWGSVGAVEADVLGHLISPGLLGGPHWPTTRQAYRVVRRGARSVLLATDGLSDPFDEGGDVNGFELELFVECPDLAPQHAGSPGDVTPLRESWMMALLSHVAGIVAEAGGINAQLDRYGVLSMELPGVSQSPAIHTQLPARYVTADDAVGILIGAPAPDFPARIDDMPLSPVRIVPLVLLTAAELGEIRAGDGSTREAIAAALAKLPDEVRNSLARDSLA